MLRGERSHGKAGKAAGRVAAERAGAGRGAEQGGRFGGAADLDGAAPHQRQVELGRVRAREGDASGQAAHARRDLAVAVRGWPRGPPSGPRCLQVI